MGEIKLENGDLKKEVTQFLLRVPRPGLLSILIEEIRVDLKPVEEAKKGDLCSIPAPDYLCRSDKIYLLIDSGVGE
ncbi:MAG: hypothetical protein MZV63_59865 [Marinilabiliales bacterium]|nr:hypothetical protein [Marinilabiliales bacterium]